MNDPHYNQDYTKEQIAEVLQEIKNAITRYNYTISLNRPENIAFRHLYQLNSSKERKTLLLVTVEDFCHTLNNTKDGYQHEVLYVFVPQVTLRNIDDEELIVDVYLKFNILDSVRGKTAVVISFHERNKPVTYRFR